MAGQEEVLFMDRKKILVTWELTGEQKEMLERNCQGAEFCYVPECDVTEAVVGDVTVILGNVPPKILKAASKLEWLQLNSAGANEYCIPGVLAEQVVLTNASGAYGLAISEHMLGMVLMLEKKLDRYYKNQKAHLWRDEGAVHGIWNSRTLVLGMGNLGTEFARRMNALGSHVVGLRRTQKQKPDCYEEQYLMDALEEELAKADIVALCLPGTEATSHLLDERRLALMKPSAILINVGRGMLVDNLALANLLRAGKLGGAAVDVTDPEPLPADHPLWEAPNVLITPHVSGGYHMKETFERILQITAENLRAYAQGERLRNQVNRKAGY